MAHIQRGIRKENHNNLDGTKNTGLKTKKILGSFFCTLFQLGRDQHDLPVLAKASEENV